MHACAFRLVNGRVTFVSAVNFSCARSGGMSAASSDEQLEDESESDDASSDNAEDDDSSAS